MLSAGGEPLAGYARQDCQAVHTDSVRQTVRWNRECAALPDGQPLRLRFHLQDAKSIQLSHPGKQVHAMNGHMVFRRLDARTPRLPRARVGQADLQVKEIFTEFYPPGWDGYGGYPTAFYDEKLGKVRALPDRVSGQGEPRPHAWE